MFITPIDSLFGQTIKGVGGIGADNIGGLGEGQAISGNSNPFKDIFQNAMNDVKETDKSASQDAGALAAGNIDDLHTLGIDSTKAYLSVRLMVEMRNRAMESYSEIMRINV